ncbi:hypothetical protein DAPPUDRAFT_250935 [Daphnia pulex]|uniref:Uncharacterized protein n=1 Tax=Daphnia pulex TaxID=6669 RepID=E9GZH0_DAPPU|nr:hypothetical protein DAPPUDRAFT_250935 [Daphnia pulex]|eukprot:EFX75160.1 hypothetical protein DAPPUDRAFT_250935 [Daphnia pulex]
MEKRSQGDRERQQKMLEKTTNYYNRDAKDLPELTIGDHVLIHNPDSKRWTTPGVVVETGPNRDYMTGNLASKLESGAAEEAAGFRLHASQPEPACQTLTLATR